MLKQRHFLSLGDFSAFDLKLLLDTADEMKKRPKSFRKALKGQTLALVLQGPAFQGRLSFEVGMHHLGGAAQAVGVEDLGLGGGEPDAALVLSRYVDGIAGIALPHHSLQGLAEQGTVPVINGGSDQEHPCQVLADLQTLREKFGRLEGLRLACIGGGRSLIQALLLGTARAGMDCTLIAPGGQSSCLPEVLERARVEHGQQGTRLLVSEDLGAVRGSHAVYGAGPCQDGFCVDEGTLELAGPTAVFMHGLPARRGAEVAPGVIDGSRSIVYDQAENRLWAQMAVLYHLMGEG